MFVMIGGEVINTDDIHRILPCGCECLKGHSHMMFHDGSVTHFKFTPGQIQAKIIRTERAKFSEQQRIVASFRPHIPRF